MDVGDSLVKREKAVVTGVDDDNGGTVAESYDQKLREFITFSASLESTDGRGKVDPEAQLRKIMDFILPGRKYEKQANIWIEKTSTVPATRIDMLTLHEKFEGALKARNAKAFGICPIRREIFDQLFDEIIRQVTINCAERGLLLLRVKHEFQLTFVTYQTLLESTIAYGIRKAIETEQQRTSVDEQAANDRNENILMKKKIEQLEQKALQEKILREEEIKLIEANLKEENEKLQHNCKTLKSQLQSILQMEQDSNQESENLSKL
uniref:Dynein light chain n=1 Tax=Rhabditophanes sp. KR3021 TaxID=114890 RepID=A0AC35UCR5_9BILA